MRPIFRAGKIPIIRSSYGQIVVQHYVGGVAINHGGRLIHLQSAISLCFPISIHMFLLLQPMISVAVTNMDVYEERFRLLKGHQITLILFISE